MGFVVSIVLYITHFDKSRNIITIQSIKFKSLNSGANIINPGANIINSGANIINSGANIVYTCVNISRVETRTTTRNSCKRCINMGFVVSIFLYITYFDKSRNIITVQTIKFKSLNSTVNIINSGANIADT